MRPLEFSPPNGWFAEELRRLAEFKTPDDCRIPTQDMLTITESTSAAQAVSYHTKDQARENYYSNGQELPGRWGGRGAERLGLAGESRAADFESLCYNLNPTTGEQLTARLKENRRVGYDFTFSAPKSVSLLYEWSGDRRILDRFDQAVNRTMEIIQEQAATRVRKGGRDENRLTKELLWCGFDHFTARPEDGVPDPQMHRHCYVFNATFDSVEGRWKAGQFGDIKAEGEHYQSIWLSEFSKGLAELGYEVVQVGKFFEIGGISRSLIEKFSNRTATIKARAEELGITDAESLAKLGAATRERKAKHLSKEELQRDWWERLTPEDVRQLNEARSRGERQRVLEADKTLEKEDGARAEAEPSREDLRAVRFAVEHLFERKSAVFERELITEALQWGYGKATLPGITRAVQEWTLVRGRKNGQTVLTTKAVLAEENRIVRRCQEGKNVAPALRPDWEILDERLTEQQRAAVQHILRSNDRILGVVGKAGAGKTTALKQAANGIRAAGKQVMAFAPTASASRRTLRESGFPEADTVARLLSSERLQREARGAVWFVDEAGLLSAGVTDKLLELADRLSARVVIVGDPGQHHSVQRGDAFRLLQEYGKMSVVTMDEIHRQQGDYKRAVENISEGRFGRAFETLEKMGALREMPLHEREAALAKRYLEIRRTGQTVLVSSPTHRECERVTAAIREALKEEGSLQKGKDLPVLRNLSWTEAERRDSRTYEPGLVVEIGAHLKGFGLGERLEVVEVTERGVKARNLKNGVTKDVPLEHPQAFGVFRRDEIEVGAGDSIRITANGRTTDGHRLNNNDYHVVKEVRPNGEVVFENGWCLKRDFPHFEYGYAPTSYASQGKTVDWVLVAQSALCSAGASDANQFYVSVSRGRHGVEIFTDSIEVLRENVARVRERMHAMEVGREEPEEERDNASRELGERAEVARLDLAEFLPKEEEREMEPMASGTLENGPRERDEHSWLADWFGRQGLESVAPACNLATRMPDPPALGREMEMELEIE